MSADLEQLKAKALASATQRVQAALGLTPSQLSAAMDSSDLATVDSDRTELTITIREKSITLIRIYQRLSSLVGDDEPAMQHWMSTRNRHLDSAPIDVIQQAGGPERILAYLEFFRK